MIKSWRQGGSSIRHNSGEGTNEKKEHFIIGMFTLKEILTSSIGSIWRFGRGRDGCKTLYSNTLRETYTNYTGITSEHAVLFVLMA